MANAGFAIWVITIDRWFARARQLGLGVNRMENINLVTGAHCTRTSLSLAAKMVCRYHFGAKVDHSGDAVATAWQFSHERNRGIMALRVRYDWPHADCAGKSTMKY